jgi:monoamine oxidase
LEAVFFAGEHCSDEFQGFMNGAAQSGRLAARAVLARITK